MRAIQPYNTDLYCIVVTSWHWILHRKLAIKILQARQLDHLLINTASFIEIKTISSCKAVQTDIT